MAFIDFSNELPRVAPRRGITLRIHPDWLAADVSAPTARGRRPRYALAALAIAGAAALDGWLAGELGSQLLALACTGIVAAVVLSLATAARR
jgi:hypothetical protein